MNGFNNFKQWVEKSLKLYFAMKLVSYVYEGFGTTNEYFNYSPDLYLDEYLNKWSNNRMLYTF